MEWACALWHAVHNTKSQGTGSLAFVAFPEQVAEMLAEAEAPDSAKVAIIGVKRNAYAESLGQFDGSRFEVRFALRPIDNKLRMCAVVGDQVLGVVSSETPVRQGQRTVTLTHSTAGEGKVVYAA